MIQYMNEIKQILQPLFIYAGTLYTIAQTWITEQALGQSQEMIGVAVSLATFIYTLQKIAEIRQRMRITKEQAENEQEEI